MNGPEPKPINVVLVFRDSARAQELGPLMQTVLREVEAFYNFGAGRVKFARLYISAAPAPDSAVADTAWTVFASVGKLWRSMVEMISPSAPAPIPVEQWKPITLGPQIEELWSASEGSFTGTVDGERLIQFVNRVTEIPPDSCQIIVVDKMVVPTGDLTYTIWNFYGSPEEDQCVVSILPLDPLYWNISDPDRLATIKQRFRSALLSLVGQFLGLTGCQEPACFLNEDVYSPEAFDGMVLLGVEHGIEPLAQKGFSLPSGDLVTVQPVETNPKPKGWQALVHQA